MYVYYRTLNHRSSTNEATRKIGKVSFNNQNGFNIEKKQKERENDVQLPVTVPTIFKDDDE